MIPKKRLEEFKQIYKEQFNKTISNKEAEAMARNLLELVKLVYSPVKKKNK